MSTTPGRRRGIEAARDNVNDLARAQMAAVAAAIDALEALPPEAREYVIARFQKPKAARRKK